MIQHFETTEFFGGEKALEHTQKLDRIKKQLCGENNLPLYYIISVMMIMWKKNRMKLFQNTNQQIIK